MEAVIPEKVTPEEPPPNENNTTEIQHKDEDLKICQEEIENEDEVEDQCESAESPHFTPIDFQELLEKVESYEQHIEQLKLELQQKDSFISLNEREREILEKEKNSLKKDKENAIKEKESIVIKFATKEKVLLDAKKEKETAVKQLNDSKKEIKNLTTKYQSLNDEKTRITQVVDEKCNEIKKLQKEIDKFKSDIGNLETKLKWNSMKLSQETEAKVMIEKRLEEVRGLPQQQEEDKATEQKEKMEYQATLILLKHELEKIEKINESFKKEQKETNDKIYSLDEQLKLESEEKNYLSVELEKLKSEHSLVQNSLTQEILNSAKLRGQLEEHNLLQTQNALNEEKITNLQLTVEDLEVKVIDLENVSLKRREKEAELLYLNQEMSEVIADLQNKGCLEQSRFKALEAENVVLVKERSELQSKYRTIEEQLKDEIKQKTDERLLLTKHLSEKTKLYENIKTKYENTMGDLEATKRKHSQIIKELTRELQKFKRLEDDRSQCSSHSSDFKETPIETNSSSRSPQHQSDSESSSDISTPQEPSKQHLIDRILRLQKAAVRQTEKIDFLENHTMSLVAELQKKSKLIQYYMIRDQAGALTSFKSDQNKSELAKYGTGVMTAIYKGVKGAHQAGNGSGAMTLELSLEINKKLQAVLEDTLLKNITLKENLDVLGIEVDKLTRKIAKTSGKG